MAVSRDIVVHAPGLFHGRSPAGRAYGANVIASGTGAGIAPRSAHGSYFVEADLLAMLGLIIARRGGEVLLENRDTPPFRALVERVRGAIRPHNEPAESRARDGDHGLPGAQTNWVTLLAAGAAAVPTLAVATSDTASAAGLVVAAALVLGTLGAVGRVVTALVRHVRSTGALSVLAAKQGKWWAALPVVRALARVLAPDALRDQLDGKRGGFLVRAGPARTAWAAAVVGGGAVAAVVLAAVGLPEVGGAVDAAAVGAVAVAVGVAVARGPPATLVERGSFQVRRLVAMARVWLANRALTRRLRGARPLPNAVVRDLDEAHCREGNPARDGKKGGRDKVAQAQARSDDELLRSVFAPADGQFIGAHATLATVIVQGNHRMRLLRERARDPNSSITWDTPIFIHRVVPAALRADPPAEVRGTVLHRQWQRMAAARASWRALAVLLLGGLVAPWVAAWLGEPAQAGAGLWRDLWVVLPPMGLVAGAALAMPRVDVLVARLTGLLVVASGAAVALAPAVDLQPAASGWVVAAGVAGAAAQMAAAWGMRHLRGPDGAAVFAHFATGTAATAAVGAAGALQAVGMGWAAATVQVVAGTVIVAVGAITLVGVGGAGHRGHGTARRAAVALAVPVAMARLAADLVVVALGLAQMMALRFARFSQSSAFGIGMPSSGWLPSAVANTERFGLVDDGRVAIPVFHVWRGWERLRDANWAGPMDEQVQSARRDSYIAAVAAGLPRRQADRLVRVRKRSASAPILALVLGYLFLPAVTTPVTPYGMKAPEGQILAAVDTEIRAAVDAASGLGAGTSAQTFPIVGTVWSGRTATENWNKTLGMYLLWGTADVRLDGTRVTVTVTVHVLDRYNFNREGLDLATAIPDEANGRFEQLGWARGFDVTGSLTRTFTAEIGSPAVERGPAAPSRLSAAEDRGDQQAMTRPYWVPVQEWHERRAWLEFLGIALVPALLFWRLVARHHPPALDPPTLLAGRGRQPEEEGRAIRRAGPRRRSRGAPVPGSRVRDRGGLGRPRGGRGGRGPDRAAVVGPGARHPPDRTAEGGPGQRARHRRSGGRPRRSTAVPRGRHRSGW